MANAVIGALRVNLGLNSAQFSNGLKNANRQAKGFSAKIGGAFKIAAASMAAIGGGVAVALKGALNEADELTKTAQKIGIPVMELSQLKYAAELAGVSMSGLSTGVRRLSQNMNDALNGIGEGKAAFDQLGISVKNSDGTLKTTSQVMAELSERFAKMPDSAQKTALAMDLMGRSGADLIPLLNGGADAMRKAMEEADRFGIVITEKTGKAAEQFNDNMTRLGKVFSGITTQLAAKLAPHLAAFTDWLVQASPQIIAITGKIGDVVMRMAGWVGELGRMASIGISAVSSLVTGIENVVGGKLAAIWDSVSAKIEWVTDKFRQMYIAVVGNSFIPDMVDEIGVAMRGLDQNMVSPISSAISSAVDSIADGTFRAREFLRNLANDIIKMFANRAIQQVLGSVFGGGNAPSIGAPINMLQPRAGGGPVMAGMPYIVGERRPELFVPDRNGTIMPRVPDGSQTTVNVINNSGASVEERRRSSGGREIVDIVVGAVNQGIAGGKLDKSMGGRYGARPVARQR